MQIDTPCLVLDLLKFRKNLDLMNDFTLQTGKKLRPHAKTHKCSQIAKLQLGQGAIGICAAKLDEAAGLLNAGIGRILLTSPVVGELKIARLMKLAGLSEGLMAVLDNIGNAVELNAHGAKSGLVLDILIDIDPEMGRTGAAFADVLPLAREVAKLKHLRLRGVQCYAGNLQHVFDYSERANISLLQMRRAQDVFVALKREFATCDIFTGAGTGTFDIDCELEFLSDVQVGSYCVMDSEYRNIASRDNGRYFESFVPALTLHCSVISNNHDEFVTLDAGLKALYYTPHAPPEVITDDKVDPGYRYEWFGDEHGKLFYPAGSVKPASGSRFELLLPHCDPTINMFDKIHVVERGNIVDLWDIDLHGSR